MNALRVRLQPVLREARNAEKPGGGCLRWKGIIFVIFRCSLKTLHKVYILSFNDGVNFHAKICTQCRNINKSQGLTFYWTTLYASAAKNAFGLAVTLTCDLWPWKPFQQWPLTWRLFAQSVIQIPPPSEEIASRGISVNGRMAERTTRKHQPLAAYYWRRRLNILHSVFCSSNAACSPKQSY